MKKDVFQITVGPETEGIRLDKLLADAMPDISRSRVKALIKEGQLVSASGIVLSPSYNVKKGDNFSLSFPEPEDADPIAENIPLDIIFEDEHLVVVNKPAGMVVHPAPGSPNGTLVNALLHHCNGSLSGIGGVKRPGIVHRIDKETSGLLIVAKHDKAHNGLAVQFADHSIERTYIAVCKGHPKKLADRIEGNIARHPVDRKRMAVAPSGGKWAATHYTVSASYAQSGTPVASLLECRLETGRTHQVRVHMAHIGHPLVGDPVYGRNAIANSIKGAARTALASFPRQALHAKSLGFIHPVSGTPFKFESSLPYDMEALLKVLEPYKL
ncbi:RluA family pseudouridine synthase [Kordiimonas pumila]|uniref:Pseudouridine synthase n=1 Tax=Kordiimonas pumila TaxID=2161677 RepID=A0ABV7D7D7_9PROT|nr:RluA family pseudouridine synthase [Kordiimonas pumila]